ncbi:dTDP-4-dehydrorhamnose 3,5-epimerase family protein [Cupriavidus necator]
MKLTPLPIPGAALVQSEPFADHRGAFARLFCTEAMAEVIGARRVVQINHSRTSAVGAVRGLHFQHASHAEMKLVRCLRGRVWDVVVDLRAGSPTLLQWHAEELSPGNARMMVIPEGCAHGFQVLEADSELLYLHTAPYTPQAEGGVRHDDPATGVRWPLPVADLSARDRSHPLLSAGFAGLHA